MALKALKNTAYIILGVLKYFKIEEKKNQKNLGFWNFSFDSSKMQHVSSSDFLMKITRLD